MKKIIFLCLLYTVHIPAREVLITANEVSNSLTFIDAQTTQRIGHVFLGPSLDHALSSSVKLFTQTNVHGLAISPDQTKIAVTSNISNSVAIYASNNFTKPLHYLNVGLSSHVSMFSPDGKELWVASRGTRTVEIFDTATFSERQFLQVNNCPSFFAFLKERPLVFISNTCTEELEVYDTKTKKLHKKIKVNGTFSPLIALTPDQKELWVIRKDKDQVLRIDTETLEPIDSINVGSYPQHVTFVKRGDKVLGIVSIGGENAVKVYEFKTMQQEQPKLLSVIIIPGVPHGLAVSADSSKAFVAGEHSDKVYTIDLTNFKLSGSTQTGLSPQSLMYVKDLNLNPEGLALLTNAEGKDTIEFILKGMSAPVNGASIAFRLIYHNVYITYIVFAHFTQKEILRFFLTTSDKKIEELKENEKTPLGYVMCFENRLRCSNFTIIPKGMIDLTKLKHKNIKFFAVNDAGKVMLTSVR